MPETGYTPTQPTGPASTPTYVETSPGSGTQHNWWVVQDSNGAIGVQNTPPGYNAVHYEYIDAAATLAELLSDPADSTLLFQAAKDVGATDNQIVGLMHQLDSGAIVNGTPNYVYIGPDSTGNQSSAGGDKGSISTKTGSEAVSSPIVSPPSVSVPSGDLGAVAAIWNWLTTPANWLRILEYIAGALLLYLGIKELAES
jgi:hypothetical protein